MLVKVSSEVFPLLMVALDLSDGVHFFIVLMYFGIKTFESTYHSKLF